MQVFSKRKSALHSAGFLFCENIKNIELARRKTKAYFSHARTPFSFKAFARSPRSKSRRVLDLKLLKIDKISLTS